MTSNLRGGWGWHACVNRHSSALAARAKQKNERVVDGRDVESDGHGGAQEDDVAPERQEGQVDRVAVHHQGSQRPLSSEDPSGKEAAADGEEQGGQQQEDDDLQASGEEQHECL